jgi:hypothetical protein
MAGKKGWDFVLNPAETRVMTFAVVTVKPGVLLKMQPLGLLAWDPAESATHLRTDKGMWAENPLKGASKSAARYGVPLLLRPFPTRIQETL